MKEIGGYLPLELYPKTELFRFSSDQMLKVNCGRAALYAALLQIKPKRVILPYYICPTITELIQSMGILYREYPITKDFQPVLPELTSGDCVILVNYFGLVDRRALALELAKKIFVILDYTQAFYAAPVFSPNVLNVYSCRKFFGVSDGGYLIGENVRDIALTEGTSWESASFLVKSIEFGTNSAYSMQKDCEEQLGKVYTKMSVFTETMMKTMEYEFVAQKRRANFQMLHQYLGPYNEINWNLSDSTVPYFYPFMIRKELRSYLLQNKIYVPIIWKEKIENSENRSIESDLSQWIYHLPVDQRYSVEDMKYLADVVKRQLEI